MQILPSPPTDNLFKFMTVSGAWLFAGCIALLGFAIYSQLKESDSISYRSHIEYGQSVVREIDRRLDSISKGKLGENKPLQLCPDRQTPVQEMECLTQVKERWGRSIKEYEQQQAVGEYEYAVRKLVTTKDFSYVYMGIFFVATVLLVFGILGWLKNQKMQNELLAKDLDIKKKQDDVLGVELDIKKLQLIQLKQTQGAYRNRNKSRN
jgi:hypothetical protein